MPNVHKVVYLVEIVALVVMAVLLATETPPAQTEKPQLKSAAHQCGSCRYLPKSIRKEPR